MIFYQVPADSVAVAVGTPATRRPPHRSRRAVFPHRALQRYALPQSANSTGEGRVRRRFVGDPWPFNPVALQARLEARPGVAALRTPAVEPCPQDGPRGGAEGVQAVGVPAAPVGVGGAPPWRVEDSPASLQRQAAVPPTPRRAGPPGAGERRARGPTLPHLLSLATPGPAPGTTENVTTRSCLEAPASYDPRLCR